MAAPPPGSGRPDGVYRRGGGNGLHRAAGRLGLRQACAQQREWHAQLGHGPIEVAVNLSVRHLYEPHLAEAVHDIVSATGADASAMCVEVTESDLMDSSERGIENLHNLKRLACE